MPGNAAAERMTGRPPQFPVEAHWRRNAFVARSVFSPAALAELSTTQLIEVVRKLPHIRVFLTPSDGDRLQRSRLVPMPDSVEIFSRLTTSRHRFTVLMNAVERADPIVRTVRDALAVPFRWRTDDIVVTYSTVGSGVGYHAGHEDAFIVQASGRRLWRVWDSREVSAEARRRLLLSHRDDIYPFVRSEAPPLLECELAPGDFLYIPPFFPHEGTTTETSISIALGWRGVSYYHLVLAFPDLVHSAGDIEPEVDDRLFDLLPDFPPTRSDLGIASTVRAVLAGLATRGCRISNDADLADRLVRLFTAAGAPVP